ncbi:MAG: hypothetical protein HQ507_07535 [Candidatus Marinimicrobia bacterium]|nr:hypothetical protein [Candidatus Neomarinimicrobiota bacterium]
MVSKLVHRLNNFPRLKSLLKRVYYYMGAVLSYWRPKKYLAQGVKLIGIPLQNPAFFGYYDLIPVLDDQILYHEIRHTSVVLGRYDIKRDSLIDIAESKAWNYQQGARLGWLGKGIVYYNDLSHGALKTVLHNLSDQSIKYLDYAAASFSPKGDYFATIDYNKVSELNPEYGYQVYINDRIPMASPPNEGLSIIETENQKILRTYTIQQIMAISPAPGQTASNSEINHVTFSPNSKSLAFVHRWYPENAGRKSRLIIDKLQVEQLEIVLDGMISHYTWIDDNRLFVYGQYENINQFITININGPKTIETHPELTGFGDGHPSFDPIHNRMVLDSYPDFFRYQSLYTYDLNESQVRLIGKFRSPSRYFGAGRCDLHPRWVGDGNAVVIDTTFTGKRGIIQLTLPDDFGSRENGMAKKPDEYGE